MRTTSTTRGDENGQDLILRPIGIRIGAEVRGLDLRDGIGTRSIDQIQEALLKHQVLSFPDQYLSPLEMLKIAKIFGRPEIHPIWGGMRGIPEVVRISRPAGESDPLSSRPKTASSFFSRPSKIILTYTDDEVANSDLIFASLTEAWKGLSKPMQNFLESLTAVHSGAADFDPTIAGARHFRGGSDSPLIYSDAIYERTEHPVVHTHHDTGKRSLFVNQAFTETIKGLGKEESRMLLDFLFRHSSRPEYGCRIVAHPKTLTIWDNQTTTQMFTEYEEERSRLLYIVAIGSEESLNASPNWPPSSHVSV
jgi:taurine dioxygenase